MGKIPENIFLPKKSYGYKHMLQTRGAWVNIKDEMLKGLYDAELKETCLFFKSKEPKRKGDIKAVLDQQLYPDRHEFKTTYVNSFEMIESCKRAIKCGKLEMAK